MKPIKPNVGGVVTGVDFFGREKDLARFGEKISDGKNILFSGPRRTGKSSLIKEFMRHYKGDKTLIYIDLEKCENLTDFSKAILNKLTGIHTRLMKGRNRVRNGWNTIAKMIQEVKAFGFGLKVGEIVVTEKQLLERLTSPIEKATKERCVFFFDEFADFILSMIKNRSDLEYFLKWFCEMKKNNKIHTVITGSVNITSTIDRINLNHLMSDPEPFHLIPLSDMETREFFLRLLLSKEIVMNGDALGYALSKLQDGHYYYVQLLADSICSLVDRGCRINNLKEIEEIYKTVVNSDTPSLAHFHSRLEWHFSEYQKMCYSLLAHLSHKSMSIEDLYPYVSENIDKKTMVFLLKRLSDEGYIVIEDNRCSFVSILLADWWHNKYYHER